MVASLSRVSVEKRKENQEAVVLPLQTQLLCKNSYGEEQMRRFLIENRSIIRFVLKCDLIISHLAM